MTWLPDPDSLPDSTGSELDDSTSLGGLVDLAVIEAQPPPMPEPAAAPAPRPSHHRWKPDWRPDPPERVVLWKDQPRHSPAAAWEPRPEGGWRPVLPCKAGKRGLRDHLAWEAELLTATEKQHSQSAM